MPSSPVPQNNLVFSAFSEFEMTKSSTSPTKFGEGPALPIILNLLVPSKKINERVYQPEHIILLIPKKSLSSNFSIALRDILHMHFVEE